MALTIRRDSTHTYPLNLSDLIEGEVYEGTDGMLYVGCDFYDKHGIYIGATGLGHNAFVDDQVSDVVFAFREVNAVITIS
jgi:hypothetical protein